MTKNYSFYLLSLLASLFMIACSGSDDSSEGGKDDGNENNTTSTPISIDVAEKSITLEKGEIKTLALQIANIPNDFTPSDIYVLSEKEQHNISVGELTYNNESGYTIRLADNAAPYHFKENMQVMYQDSIAATFTVESANYDEQVQAKPTEETTPVRLTQKIHMQQAPKEGASYSLTFTAEKPWVIYATENDEEVYDVNISKAEGEAGTHTIEVVIPENTSENGRNIKFDILYENENSEAHNRSFIGNAIMNGVFYAFTSFAVAQVGYYDILRLEHIHFDQPGGLAEALRNEFNCNDDELAYLATELYINGPMNDDDFEFIKEKLTNIRVLNLLNADVASIPEFALEKCQSLKYIVLPLKLQSIGRQAFYKTGLKNASLIMPPLLSSVGASAFEDTNLSGAIYFTGTSSTVNIGGYAFAKTGINMIFFGEGVNVINENKYGVALSLGMTNILYLYLPSTLNQINNYFFNVGDGYNIARVDCNSIYPPSTYGHFATDKVGCLFIPFYSYGKYCEDNYWGRFDLFDKMIPVLF